MSCGAFPGATASLGYSTPLAASYQIAYRSLISSNVVKAMCLAVMIQKESVSKASGRFHQDGRQPAGKINP
jgi:hypothetical protein